MEMNSISHHLNECRVKKTDLIINRLHTFLHGIALLCLFYYRTKTLSSIIKSREIPILPYVSVFVSELVLSFLWLLHQAFRWRPVIRSVYPERLPGDEKLPGIDVFVCTADPNKEPSLEVMNTVISAMALDYPPEKIAVYLSDDGGSYVTFYAMREAWKFAKSWIPFCRKYGVINRCPEAYFFTTGSNSGNSSGCSEFFTEKKQNKKMYEKFKESLVKISAEAGSGSVSRDHPSMVEVISDTNGDMEDSTEVEMPLLVYVAREKRPSHHHHFKAGALNVLIRISAIISNAPYILVLDCDHYCNDPSSARQAMCFYLDHRTSPNLAFVQFPQKFHNTSNDDIYDGRLQYYWRRWLGMDGVRGPSISGSNFYLRRDALYGPHEIRRDIDLKQLKKSFGSSNEFLESIYRNYRRNLLKERKIGAGLEREIQLVASCTYDNQSQWGEEVGFMYFSVVEDVVTSVRLHCNGWTSVFINPQRPCFLGASPTNLNDTLVQRTRWSLGLMQAALSKYSPLSYGPLRMSILQSMCYSANALDPLYVLPMYGLSLIPQICLLHGVPLYPKVSDPFFMVFAFLFLSSQLKHVQEVVSYGDSIATSLYELRIWMMASASSYLYATLNALLEKIGMHDANFTLTNKVVDTEQAKRHQKGIYDFQSSPQLIVPMCSLYLINVATFIIGTARILKTHQWNELFVQAFIPFVGIVVNYQLFEGVVLRKDKGRISAYISLVSFVVSVVLLCFGSLFLSHLFK